ncbi:transposase IS66 family protein, partial [Escherichia coli FRIK1997]
PATVSSE